MATRRLKAFWGAIDISYSDESPYTAAETKPLGTNANSPGIGARRAQIVWSREGFTVPEDKMVTHMDFLNITGGNPDDTWVDSDFALLEGHIQNWWTNIKGLASTLVVADQIRWYKVGLGIGTPNPAVRITETSSPGTGTEGLPPQVAVSVTNRTVPRRQWGRMYLPLNSKSGCDTEGFLIDASALLVAQQTAALYQAALTADFQPVVWSHVRSKLYGIEEVQVDDVYDVMRSRRFDKPGSRARVPLT